MKHSVIKCRALITGITGQDGSYLAELLLEKGYEVWGIVRRSSTHGTERIDHIIDQVNILEADMTDMPSLIRAVDIASPYEVYNLAAQSFVKTSWDEPILTADVTGLGAVRLMHAVFNRDPATRFYQASTSELFGGTPYDTSKPLNELTSFYPKSPYAAAKAYAHYMVHNFREGYGMYAVSGILFNHESPRRGEEFVTRKIAKAAARIRYGLQGNLSLGNVIAIRDWGFAGDYVRAMWLMLQREKPEDYVIATGKGHTVAQFCEVAFNVVGLDWAKYVNTNCSAHLRPTEVWWLKGDAQKARNDLGWEPSVTFQELVEMMVQAECAICSQEKNKEA